jgi:dihydroorotase
MLTDPPVRSERIVKRLWTAIKGNEVEILASDHAPHLMREKTADSVWDVKPGIPGLETLLPLFLTKVNENQLSIAELARLLAEEPARIFHLRNEGFLREGCNANITVVDMHKKGKIKAEMFHSKAKYSPFDGWRVKGLPSKTFVNGRLAMEDGYLVANRGIGKITRCGDEGHDTA